MLFGDRLLTFFGVESSGPGEELVLSHALAVTTAESVLTTSAEGVGKIQAVPSITLADLMGIRGALLADYEAHADSSFFSDLVELDEQILTLCPAGHPGRMDACERLSTSLHMVSIVEDAFSAPESAGSAPDTDLDMLRMTRGALWEHCQDTGDTDSLEEMICLDEQILALCVVKDAARASACSNLADSLRLCLRHMSSISNVPTTVDDIPLSTSVTASTNLPQSLWERYIETQDLEVLEQVIANGVAALDSLPEEDTRRVGACFILAVSLREKHKQTGDRGVLHQCIQLLGEAYALSTTGHIFRPEICGEYAKALRKLYNHTGDISLLVEATELNREALSLLPSGHPDRPTTCGNLAVSLGIHYDQTGDTSLLIEATELEREALSLHPPGHPDRAMSCANLAVSLSTHHNQTGDTSLLIEATELDREALSLRPPGHPDRAISCANLAVSLSTRHKQTGDNSLLIEAIELGREALSLLPPGHPNRATSCANLATSLSMRYKQTGDTSLLIKATKLNREALSLLPPGHPDHAMSCANLAISLASRYDRTDDIRLLNEAINLSEQASRCSSSSTIWRSLSLQCRLYLSQRAGSELAIPRALPHLVQWSQLEADDMQAFMASIGSQLSVFWTLRAAWTDAIPSSLVSVYSNVIDKLPLMAAFVLDTTSRLSALRSFTRLGSQACVVAIMAHDLSQAIELLDHAHGVIWAQALHQRDPQLAGVPPVLASELDSLLRSIALPVVPELPGRHSTTRDFRHEQNSRIQTILGEIRAMPGLDRFMRGSTFDTLREVARDHPVVVLVAVDDESYAVIISSSSQEGLDVIKLDASSQRMMDLGGRTRRGFYRGSTNDGWRNSRGDSVQDLGGMEDSERIMRPGGHINTLHGVLSQLWRLIVKPVLTHLGLEVSLLIRPMHLFD
jgi:hypothetical protein